MQQTAAMLVEYATEELSAEQAAEATRRAEAWIADRTFPAP